MIFRDDILTGSLPSLPIYCDWAFDFDKKCLKTAAGRHFLVYGDDALKFLIWKILQTKKGRYAMYSNDFGIDLSQIIGKVPTSAIELAVKTALQSVPYIVGIRDFRLEHMEYKHNISFTVVSIYGEFNVDYGNI